MKYDGGLGRGLAKYTYLVGWLDEVMGHRSCYKNLIQGKGEVNEQTSHMSIRLAQIP